MFDRHICDYVPQPVKRNLENDVIKGMIEAGEPVSYTHLDVYKRQVRLSQCPAVSDSKKFRCGDDLLIKALRIPVHHDRIIAKLLANTALKMCIRDSPGTVVLEEPEP